MSNPPPGPPNDGHPTNDHAGNNSGQLPSGPSHHLNTNPTTTTNHAYRNEQHHGTSYARGDAHGHGHGHGYGNGNGYGSGYGGGY